MNPSPRTPQDHTPRAKRLLRLFWKHLPRLILLVMVLVVILLMGVVSARKEQLAQERKAAHVEEKKLVNAILLELRPRPMEDAINLPGSVEPWNRLELLAKVSGAITEVRVKEGDRVKAGQTLAMIETDDYRLSLDAARASFALAKAEFDRNRSMHQSKVVAAASLESSETRMQTARAELERAQLQLSRCTITAPTDSVVKRLDAKIGLYLNVGDPLAELLQLDQVKAVVGIPESDVDAVRRVGQAAITIQALDNREVTGRKHYLAPAPDAGARLFRLELALDNPGHEILPGMFFRAHVVKRHMPEALAVPLYSIITRAKEQYVYVVDGDTVRRQPVRLGVLQGWMVEVTDGLKPGDRVVLEGHREVEDGERVQVIKVVNDPQELLP